ncbi:MAG: hypothetical protein SGI86_04540 [Deltaproteobacteria bacterium]|nr:hypothetical protein [Deltaproteobacteria bacterium]
MRALVLAFIALVGSVSSVRGDGSLQIRGEGGLEYDSNAGRAEQVSQETPVPTVGSAAGRFVGSASSNLNLGERWSLALSGGGALKGFTESAAQPENIALVQASPGAFVRLLPGTVLASNLSYYDAFQKGGLDTRDFRSVSPGMQLQQRIGGGALGMGGGYRWFTFKSTSDFNFAGPLAFLTYRKAFLADLDVEPDAADWELSASLSHEQRNFKGERCRQDACVANSRHVDDFTVVSAELIRTGEHLFGLGTALQINGSNSFGNGLVRLAAHANAGLSLPWELTLTLRAELLFTRYSDPVPLARDPVTAQPRASIEEESRNTIRAELTRSLDEHFEGIVRYVFYTNELAGGPVDYRRHTLLFALAFLFDRD